MEDFLKLTIDFLDPGETWRLSRVSTYNADHTNPCFFTRAKLIPNTEQTAKQQSLTKLGESEAFLFDRSVFPCVFSSAFRCFPRASSVFPVVFTGSRQVRGVVSEIVGMDALMDAAGAERGIGVCFKVVLTQCFSMFLMFLVCLVYFSSLVFFFVVSLRCCLRYVCFVFCFFFSMVFYLVLLGMVWDVFVVFVCLFV